MSKLKFNNYSRFSRKSRGKNLFTDIYAWCVFLEGDAELMNRIEMVEYTLHPTFPRPVREITDKEHCFALQSEGWGTFKIDIRVFFDNGFEQNESYLLRLEDDDWPKGPALERFSNKDAQLVYRILLDPKWEWRKTSTIVELAKLTTDKVLAVLKNLASDGYVRESNFRSIENEELWGATSRVGILPTVTLR